MESYTTVEYKYLPIVFVANVRKLPHWHR